MKKVPILISKEVKQLLKDRKVLITMIFFPIVMFSLMGGMVGEVVQSQIKAALSHPIHVAVVSEDPAPPKLNVMYILLGKLVKVGVNATFYNVTPPEKAKKMWEEVLEKNPKGLQQLSYYIKDLGRMECPSSPPKGLIKKLLGNMTPVIFVPANFSWNVYGGWKCNITTYIPLPRKPLSTGITTLAEREEHLGDAISKAISELKISIFAPGQNPESFLKPLANKIETYYMGKIYSVPPSQISSGFAARFALIPIIAYMIVIFSTTGSATNIGNEKQNKTLETLLTLPVSRNEILVGKLFGTMLPAILSTISYLIGFKIYISNFQSSVSSSSPEISKVIANLFHYTVTSYLFLGVIIFLTIAVAGLIGLLIGTYADSPRTASSLATFIVMPLAVPVFVMVYMPVDVHTAAGMLIFADPFSHIVLTAENALVGDYIDILYSIGYLVALTSLMFAITAKVFNSERLVTGGFKKKKRTRARPIGLLHWP